MHSSCGDVVVASTGSLGQSSSGSFWDGVGARAGDLTMYVCRTALSRGVTIVSRSGLGIEPHMLMWSVCVFEKTLVWTLGAAEY